MSRKVVLAAAVAVLLVLGILPLAVVFIESLQVGGRWSLAHYEELIASGNAPTLLANSLRLATSTLTLAVPLGVILGILMVKTDLLGRGLFTLLFTIPLLIPPYITAVSWFDVLGRHGLISRIGGSSLAEWTSANLFGLSGSVLVLSSTFLPIPMLLTMALLRTVNPRLEEAARLVAGWPAVLKGITLPLILPGLTLVATLVFMLALGELGVPLFLRYDVFPVVSFTQFSAFLNFGAAAANVVPVLLLALTILGMEWRLLKDRIRPFRYGPASETFHRIPLTRLRIPLFCLVALLCAFLILVPYAGLLWESMSAAAYLEAWSRGKDSLFRSLAFAALGASLLSVLGFLFGYAIHTKTLRIWRALDGFTLCLFSVPGAVIGIGLITLWNHPSTRLVYGTPLIILFGYLAQYIALTTRAAEGALGPIPASMEEAAQLAGAGWIRRISLIIVPLASRGLVAGWLVAYIFCLRDLSISMLVYPPGQDTLPVRIFTLMANGAPPLIAALCVILALTTLIPLAGLGFAIKGGFMSRGIH